MCRAGRYRLKLIPPKTAPYQFLHSPGLPSSVRCFQCWLVFLIQSEQTLGCCLAKSPDGTLVPACGQLTDGKTTVVCIARYAEVCLAGLALLKAVLETSSPDGGELALVPGGYTLGDRRHSLTGRPLALLRALLAAPGRCATAEQLRKSMGVDDEAVTYPDQVIRDAAGDLRASLREAAGLAWDQDPLPSEGRGADLAYRLDLP
jgi:hypothetical protein